jgi:hypothetical protein
VTAHNVGIFISHSWSYPHHYDTLAEWIFGEGWQFQNTPINFYDASVPKNNPIHNAPNDSALRTAIFNRISLCDVVVIPTGMYTTHSKWIKNEIEGAHLFRKPILAVNPWGQERKSSIVSQAAHMTVGWNKQSVVNGIWKLR